MILVIPGRPPTANSFLRSHSVYNWREKTKPIREAAGYLALAKASDWPPPPISISYRGRYRSGRSLPDPGGLALAAKAAVDGLIDAGMIPDDNWRYISRLEELSPIIVPGVDEALILEVG